MGLGSALKVARTFWGTMGENSWDGGDAAVAIPRTLESKSREYIQVPSGSEGELSEWYLCRFLG